MMFDRFTDEARRLVMQAQFEAKELNHAYIGTEHLLLALTNDDAGLAATILAKLSIAHDEVADQIRGMIGVPEETPRGHIPFTQRAKRVLEGALTEALHLDQSYVGTEHILLAIIREGEGVAADILALLGPDGIIDAEVMRLAVIKAARGKNFLPLQPPYRPSIDESKRASIFEYAVPEGTVSVVSANLIVFPALDPSRAPNEEVKELIQVFNGFLDRAVDVAEVIYELLEHPAE